MSPKTQKDKDEPEVTCPVCAGIVTLEDPFCPHCGAEFEEEEVEEIVEEEVPTVEALPESPEPEEVLPDDIDERPEVEALPEDVPLEAPVDELPTEEISADEFMPGPDEPVEILAEEESPACAPPEEKPQVVTTSLSDVKVIGISILILGIVAGSIMLNIRWFWTWVPPIRDYLIGYAIIGMAVILIAFMLFRKMATDTEKKGKAPLHPMLPSVMLALIQFGFYAVIMFVLYDPINNALKSFSAGASLIFIAIAVVGLIIYFWDTRYRTARQSDKA